MTISAGRDAVWHEVECGRYAADLALWSALTREAAGPVLELGCGTGRVALHLAGEGFEVTGLDSSPELAAELSRRAEEAGLAVEVVIGETREFALGRRFAVVLAPMQLVHLLGGPGGRRAMLERVAAHLHPAGTFAAALLAAELAAEGADTDPVLPDVAERDGWLYSSLPVEVLAIDGGFEVRRLRQLVSPSGELSERIEAIKLERLDADRFEAEAVSAGLAVRERIEIAPTDDHVGSTVCVLEARR